ncbi:MAG TPA: DUF4097 family beta strand repeat-containing protein [Terriglobales bacterium]|nr:DUF4097 family beta strand repeat-containing protein [Terriglobales bacterium]
MVTRQRVGKVTVILVTCVVVATASERKEFKYTVGPGASVTINNQFGPVSVKPSNGNQVIVTAILQSNKVEIDDSKIGDRVELKSHLLPGASPDNARVEYEVLVPADASVSIHSTNGPLRAEQLHGDLTLEGDTATMEVHDVSDSHVHVNSLTGPVTLTNIHNGHVEISSVSGEVVLNSVSGPLVAVTSTRGKIQYVGDFGTGGEYKLTSHTGDIEAIIPADASFDVIAKSMRGDVQNDFPLQPKHHLTFVPEKGRSFGGTAGKAASSVLLRTLSGKIRLKKR